MRIPRNLSGMELATLLRRHYGYNLISQRGSHMRLASTFMGYEHHVSVPRHNPLKVATLDDIIGNVAEYLEIRQDELMRKLFGR